MTKARTQVQIDALTNKRLLKTYGITLAEYDRMCATHDGVCWICSKPPGKVRLSVDHDHAVNRVKVRTEKASTGQWGAEAIYKGILYVCHNKKRGLAIKEVKGYLKRASVRGILCSWCNRGLRYYRDNPEFMKKAAEYLERHQGVQT